MNFSEHQIGRLERLFGQTLPDALPTPAQVQHQLRRVREAMRHATPDQRALFEVGEDGKVYARSDGRHITNMVQFGAEEYYADALEDQNPEWEHDGDAEAFYHKEYGDLVVDRYTFSQSLYFGGHRRGFYANPWMSRPHAVEGGGVPTHEDL